MLQRAAQIRFALFVAAQLVPMRGAQLWAQTASSKSHCSEVTLVADSTPAPKYRHASTRTPVPSPGPSFVSGPRPRYPQSVYAVGRPGYVRLKFVVWCDGSIIPGRVSVQGASDPDLIDPVVNALIHSRYQPATVRGDTVAVTVVQTFAFTP